MAARPKSQAPGRSPIGQGKATLYLGGGNGGEGNVVMKASRSEDRADTRRCAHAGLEGVSDAGGPRFIGVTVGARSSRSCRPPTVASRERTLVVSQYTINRKI